MLFFLTKKSSDLKVAGLARKEQMVWFDLRAHLEKLF